MAQTIQNYTFTSGSARMKTCWHCGWPINGETVKWIAARENDPKQYVLYLHLACAEWLEGKKIVDKSKPVL
jgi:hypothetical protein